MSRNIQDLIPGVREKAQAFLDKCKAENFPVLITDTLRTFAEQRALYNQGRTTPGERVTKADAGHSWHNFGRAFDAVPLRDGEPWWKAPDNVWIRMGIIGESCGLEWGGRWTVEVEGIVDRPHFEDRGGMTIAEAREKEMPADFKNA